MAGLDNIKSVAPDSSTEADTPDATETGALSAAGKTPQSKDKFLQGTPAANNPAAINEELLKNMQAMIAEREAQKRGFLSTMRDANAWWSGGVAGPGEALSRRALEKENESASIFNMKNQLAQYNALLGANANQAKSLQGTLSPTGTPAAGGAPGAPGVPGAGTAALMPIAAQNEMKRLLSLNPPDVAGANAIRQKWIGNETKFDAARQTQQEYVIGGKKYDLTPDEFAYFKQTGQLPGQQAPAVSTAPTLGPNSSAAAAAGIPVLSGYRDDAKQAALKAASQQPGYKGPPVAEPGHSLHQTDEAIDVPDYNALKPEQKKWLADNGYRQTFPKTSPNHLTKIPGIGAATSPSLPQQKAELQANVPFPNATNKAEIKANEEAIAKQAAIKTEAAGKEALTSAELSGKDLNQLQLDSERANKTIAAADRVIQLADDPKLNKVMGWMHGGNKAATYLGAVPKFAADVVGKGDKLEEAAKDVAWAGDKDLVAANQQLKTDSTQLGIEYTQSMFKGARLGIGLEKLGLQGKGVSPEYLPQVNKLYATLAKDSAEFDIKKNQAFKEWKGNDTSKTYRDFLSTPGYEKMMQDERDLLMSRHPGITVNILGVPGSTAEHKTTKSGVKYKVL